MPPNSRPRPVIRRPASVARRRPSSPGPHLPSPVSRRRAGRVDYKPKPEPVSLGEPCYTFEQTLGIIGIVVFLVPVFFGISATLARGGVILLLLALAPLPFPGAIDLAVRIILGTVAFFASFSFTYYLCELVWPKKGRHEDREEHAC